MSAQGGSTVALPTGRMVLDYERGSVAACSAVYPMLGPEWIDAVARFVNQPRRGAQDLTSRTRDALRSSLPTYTILDGATDAISSARVVLVVDPVSQPGQTVECFTVDYSSTERVDRLSEHLMGVVLGAPDSPTAREIEHLSGLYSIDALTAFSIRCYRQNH
ncbi:MAG: hypothetical protein DI630_07410 [Gordonia sp. (in: high G+C Gram-positive bacteria)]|nr:MAG: hypothetical protein DI630_07410 [Gordonia sp. (in: high G+C Gram-positive bacteria)]